MLAIWSLSVLGLGFVSLLIRLVLEH